MNTSTTLERHRGMTLIEVMVVVVVVVLLFTLLLWPAVSKMRDHDQRIRCVNNLKQVGLAAYVWIDDHSGKYPMEISQTNGGTREFSTGANAFRHFQIMSNNLSTPSILLCPADSDRHRTLASNFWSFSNSNLSYSIGIFADQTNGKPILSSDRDLTNGLPFRNGILDLPTNQPVGWSSQLHKNCGNLVFGDGSVEETGVFGLREALSARRNILAENNQFVELTNTVPFTNRLQMPILTP
jgi:prepilin-type N-terminal cleavage/methylation domain-containing protein